MPADEELGGGSEQTGRREPWPGAVVATEERLSTARAPSLAAIASARAALERTAMLRRGRGRCSMVPWAARRPPSATPRRW